MLETYLVVSYLVVKSNADSGIRVGFDRRSADAWESRAATI